MIGYQPVPVAIFGGSSINGAIFLTTFKISAKNTFRTMCYEFSPCVSLIFLFCYNETLGNKSHNFGKVTS